MEVKSSWMCPETNRELGGQPWNNNSKYRQIQNNFFLSSNFQFFFAFWGLYLSLCRELELFAKDTNHTNEIQVGYSLTNITSDKWLSLNSNGLEFTIYTWGPPVSFIGRNLLFIKEKWSLIVTLSARQIFFDV